MVPFNNITMTTVNISKLFCYNCIVECPLPLYTITTHEPHRSTLWESRKESLRCCEKSNAQIVALYISSANCNTVSSDICLEESFFFCCSVSSSSLCASGRRRRRRRRKRSKTARNGGQRNFSDEEDMDDLWWRFCVCLSLCLTCFFCCLFSFLSCLLFCFGFLLKVFFFFFFIIKLG